MLRMNTASQTLTLVQFYCTYGKLGQKMETAAKRMRKKLEYLCEIEGEEDERGSVLNPRKFTLVLEGLRCAEMGQYK
jgi:hypothetical protein